MYSFYIITSFAKVKVSYYIGLNTTFQPFSLFIDQKYVREKLRIRKKCQTFVKSKGKSFGLSFFNKP